MIKSIKKLLLIILCITMLPLASNGEATAQHTQKAEALKSLELFVGTPNGFELHRTGTRAEAAAMLVRLLGVEKEAKENKYKHPFTDVPAWADHYIGYMYEKGLTTGVGNNRYGSNQNLDGNAYATFILRALGYNYIRGDFKWSNALEFSKGIGLLSDKELESIGKNEFKRDELVLISYNALKTNLKDSTKTLAEKLITSSAIRPEIALKNNLLDKDKYGVLPYVVREVNGEKLVNILYTEIENFNVKDTYFIEDYMIVYSSFTMETKIKKIFMTEEFKKRMLSHITNAKKGELIKDINDNTVRDIKEETAHLSKFNRVIVFYDKKLEPTHYIEIPRNLEVGSHYLPILPVGEELINLYLSYEKGAMDFIEKYEAKINTVPKEAITIHETKEDNRISRYGKINRELLPSSMKGFKHVFIIETPADNPKDGLTEMLRHIWINEGGAFPVYEEGIDKEDNIKLDGIGYTVITLLSEDRTPLGYFTVNLTP